MDELKPSQTALPERIGIIGTGMIGTSLLLSLKAHGYSPTITAFDTDRACLQRANELVGFNLCATSLQQVAEQSDMVVLAIPPRAINDVLSHIGDLDDSVLISDVSSIKRSVNQTAESVMGDRCGQFISAHPIAGSERSGAEAAHAQMFRMCTVIITPLEQNAMASIQSMADLWYKAGASRIIQMGAEEHDRIFAHTSHFPHALAYILMHSLINATSVQDVLSYSAGGLHGFTRIAASNPDLWCDILMSNSDQVLSALQSFNVSSNQLHTMLRECDRKGLRNFFQQVTDLQSQLNELNK